MSSSPFGRDLDHPFRQFECRNSNLPIRNVHVRFGEPHSSKNSSDPLNLKISEILGPFNHVSPHLLSELKDSPDSLFGIERPDTPTSPLSKKIPFRPTNSLDKISTNTSPKHHRQKATDQKPVRMIGQNSQVVPTGKRHTPKQSFNATGQKPSQVLKQRKQQLPNDIKSRPTNQHPLHHPGKHGSRMLLSSPSANSTNTQPHKSSPSNGKKYKHEDKKAQSSSSLPIGPNKRPDKFKLKEDSFTNRTINGETLNLGQKSSPKEDSKTAVVIPGRTLKPPNEKSRPATSKIAGEVTPKRNPLPNLDLSLSRQNLHDDSNDIFALVMEPLPTPLTEIQTPDGIKKFQSFPTNFMRTFPHEKPILAPVRQTQQKSSVHPASSDPDTSDSEPEEQRTMAVPQNSLASTFLDIVVSSDSDSSDSSPLHPIAFPDGGDREDIFQPPSPKRTEKVTETPPVHSPGCWGSSPSSDSSNEDDIEGAWSKRDISQTSLGHAASINKNLYPTWDPPRLPTPPIDVKPTPLELSTESIMHYSNATTRSRERMSDDSDSSSPDKKRLKISISLDKVAVPYRGTEKIRSLIVSFPRDKISLPGEKLPESKQTARVHPIQRNPDSGKDMSAAAPTHSYPPRVAEVLPQQKISRKSPHNMTGFQSPDQLRHREPCFDPPAPPTQLTTCTQSTASDRSSGNSDLSFQSKLTRLSTSQHYLTEAKDLKHQADNFKSNYKKAIYYCEAALSFMLYGDQLEMTSKGDAITTYTDTFDLLDFVLRPCSSRGGLGFTKQCPQLTTICFRCQAIILNRIFVIKQETLKSTHRELHEFFSVYKSDTKAKTPLSNKSPYADAASSWTPNMVQVPQRIATMNSDYLQVLEYQFNSLELWSKSEEDSLAFIQRLDESAGKSIEIHSSIRGATSWCRLGLQLLKKD